jgi:homocysteine S-methyltransferase
VPKPKVPTVVEVMPLQSYKHAEFCHNELAGVVIPDEHLAKMREAGDQGMHVGHQLAMELLEEVAPLCQGVLLVPSFHRYEMVAELVREARRLGDRVPAVV